MTPEEIESLQPELVVSTNNIINKIDPSFRIIKTKIKDNKNQYFFDGSEVYHYSDGKEFFIRTVTQDFEEFKKIIN